MYTLSCRILAWTPGWKSGASVTARIECKELFVGYHVGYEWENESQLGCKTQGEKKNQKNIAKQKYELALFWAIFYKKNHCKSGWEISHNYNRPQIKVACAVRNPQPTPAVGRYSTTRPISCRRRMRRSGWTPRRRYSHVTAEAPSTET